MWLSSNRELWEVLSGRNVWKRNSKGKNGKFRVKRKTSRRSLQKTLRARPRQKWDWIKDKQILRSDEWLQISMLDTMVLGYSRTKDLDEETVQSGFVVLRKRYLSSFANPPRQQNKYILLDKSIRKKDFGQFKLLCDRWRYL